ncbi:MAG: SDR family oxidoreductase [Sinimarinibacterium sp.]|jgi:NAD(P)-dependent dehydrogenase (short-subunit alcohol dehydrogenase family)
MTNIEWSAAHLPELSGKRALVTGAASGLGFETALGLASRGAEVILADKNVAGGNAAVERIRAQVASARVEFREIDLADLAFVRRFAEALVAEGRALDIVINNAGILPPLERRTTKDGFELKFGINVLGHFALDAQLWPLLQKSAAPRVVWVSSLVHRHGRLDFDDLNAERRYDPQRVYNQAKLACLVLAMEQQARAQAAGSSVAVLAAHPGVARTALGNSRAGQTRRRITDHLADAALWLVMRYFGQDQDRGARPILYAAAAADARGGEFYGPDGFGEMAGEPRRVKPSKPALDAGIRTRLWDACQLMTEAPCHW